MTTYIKPHHRNETQHIAYGGGKGMPVSCPPVMMPIANPDFDNIETYLPFETFSECAAALDSPRLNHQINDAYLLHRYVCNYIYCGLEWAPKNSHYPHDKETNPLEKNVHYGHPQYSRLLILGAFTLWREYPMALACYYNAMLAEYLDRYPEYTGVDGHVKEPESMEEANLTRHFIDGRQVGIRNTIISRRYYLEHQQQESIRSMMLPPWLDTESLHCNYRGHLIHQWPEYYRDRLGWTDPPVDRVVYEIFA